ncbi:CPBP family intramembrane glutamic endopeptidase [Candidatus Leptofilum sp.]|uniref:CPBP family intramembrane glutamic endopeptidase n=1 Tax=Candidatus Leptofilum sp. TaxID=3241576 RepID=UPI003B590169
MKGSKSFWETIGELLKTNKLAIFLEIAMVILPFWGGVLLNGRIGNDHISLGGNLILLGGPIVYLGLAVSLFLLWSATRLRGAGWGYFGLIPQKGWLRPVMLTLGVALVTLAAVKTVINPIINAIPAWGVPDLSRFDYLNGDLPNLIIQLVVIWLTAGFLEEFIFRGYLINRLTDLFSGRFQLAWVLALVAQAVIFGLVHAYQSPVGMFKVGVIGLAFGLSYLAIDRNLWPLIIAHGLIDSLDMVSHYFVGNEPELFTNSCYAVQDYKSLTQTGKYLKCGQDFCSLPRRSA